jgi:SAM-dependent methyltransferase
VTTAFDALAADYDQTFTHTDLGRRLRSLVWDRLDDIVHAGDRVLELSCGTGEDAVHLASLGASVLATDIAPAMVEVTRAKAIAAGVVATARLLAMEEVGTLDDVFDVVVSNFGGLNCVDDVAAFGRNLAAVVRPGGAVVLVVMGPYVPWEWAWYLAHRQPGKAVRRLRRSVEWNGIAIRYPNVRQLRRAMAPQFELRDVRPIGVALPPSYIGSWLDRRPRLARALDKVERRAAGVPGTAWLGDHYLAEFVRT